MKMKPIPVIKPKPYVEEDDSYLKPGMKDEKEGSQMPKGMPKRMPKKGMQLPKKNVAPGRSKRDALMGKLKKMGK
jgi:hypothetical protein